MTSPPERFAFAVARAQTELRKARKLLPATIHNDQPAASAAYFLERAQAQCRHALEAYDPIKPGDSE